LGKIAVNTLSLFFNLQINFYHNCSGSIPSSRSLASRAWLFVVLALKGLQVVLPVVVLTVVAVLVPNRREMGDYKICSSIGQV
jgi:hypothetical protein